MYHPTEIEPLSKAQVSKLLSGQPTRVKHGRGHKIAVSAEQHKKLHKAHQKGAGITLVLDPYQQEMHRHMHGEGFLSKAKALASKGLAKAKQFYKANETRLAPLAEQAKAFATSKLMHYGSKLAPHVEKRFGSLGSQALQSGLDMGAEHISRFGEEEPMEGEGFREFARDARRLGQRVGRAVRSGVSAVGRAAAPALGSLAGAEFGPMGSIAGSAFAQKLAGGRLAHHKGGSKHPGSAGRKGKKGGALIAAGYGGGCY